MLCTTNILKKIQTSLKVIKKSFVNVNKNTKNKHFGELLARDQRQSSNLHFKNEMNFFWNQITSFVKLSGYSGTSEKSFANVSILNKN